MRIEEKTGMLTKDACLRMGESSKPLTTPLPGVSARRADVGSTHAATHTGVARGAVLGTAARTLAHLVRNRAAEIAHCSCVVLVVLMSLNQVFSMKKEEKERKKNEKNERNPSLQMQRKCKRSGFFFRGFFSVSFRLEASVVRVFGGLGSWSGECAERQHSRSC